MKFAEWVRTLPPGPLEYISADFRAFETAVTGSMIQAPAALAGAIARIAADRLSRGLALDPAEVDANYVRRSDAELFWKEP